MVALVRELDLPAGTIAHLESSRKSQDGICFPGVRQGAPCLLFAGTRFFAATKVVNDRKCKFSDFASGELVVNHGRLVGVVVQGLRG
jgi:hypothetical protein